MLVHLQHSIFKSFNQTDITLQCQGYHLKSTTKERWSQKSSLWALFLKLVPFWRLDIPYQELLFYKGGDDYHVSVAADYVIKILSGQFVPLVQINRHID